MKSPSNGAIGFFHFSEKDANVTRQIPWANFQLMSWLQNTHNISWTDYSRSLIQLHIHWYSKYRGYKALKIQIL